MRTMKRGFTLVEILIVVVILGILAAIVIPQFSQASTEAKENSLASSLQTMRSQISLYKIQHNDHAPALADLQLDYTVLGTGAMTGCSNQGDPTTGDIDIVVPNLKDAAHPFGPYLQAMPVNPFTASNNIAAGTAGGGGAAAWVYNATTGEIWAGDTGSTAAGVTHASF